MTKAKNIALKSPELEMRSWLWALASAALGLLPLLLQLPTGTALAVGAVGVLSALASLKRRIPTALRVLLALTVLAAVLLTTGPRFGRDTGCALLAAMLAIKPTETTSLRDGRSLVGFSLFSPFAAFLLDQGPITMVLGLLAVLCALITMQRLAALESGLLVNDTATAGTNPWQIGRLVLMGIPLVLVAFWLFPRLSSPLWGLPERAISRPGLSDTMNPGDWVDLMADDTPAARVTFFGPTPQNSQMYWRGPVLSEFDGRVWRQGWNGGNRPAPPIQRQGTIYDYQLDYEPTDQRHLISLDLPLNTPSDTSLSGTYELTSQYPLTSPSRWRMQSQASASFDTNLNRAQRRQNLWLPRGFNPRTVALGQQWRQEAGPQGDAIIVERALTWIRQDFAYTLETELPGRDIADDFLFETQAGFCEQFSSSFVILMRAAGIPSRVVTGYAGGIRNPMGNGYWIVRRMDAHAWAEVWLPQRGWVRVDPTAAVAPERIYDTLDTQSQASSGDTSDTALPTLSQYAQISDWLHQKWNDLILTFDAKRQRQLLQPFGINQLNESTLILIFALLGSTVLLGMAWLLTRGERECDPLLRQWHRLGQRYRHLGLAPQPHEPALTWANRVAQTRQGKIGARKNAELIALSQRFVKTRYASEQDSATLLRDLRKHRP